MPVRKNRKRENIVLAVVMVLVVNNDEFTKDVHENVLGFQLEDTEEPGDRHDTLEKIQREEENLGTGGWT